MNTSSTRLARALALALCLALTAASLGQDEEAPAEPLVLGSGAHRYRWVADWLELPFEGELGSTHGGVAVDGAGRVLFSTDTERAVMVVRPDGGFVESWGKPYANGLHGMALVREGQQEFLLLAHTGRHEVVKTTLAGEVVWTLGWPEESRKYQKREEYLPTAVAVGPDGRLFVADGYGKSWVHVYDAERNWLRAIGGPGSGPGSFRTPHGLCIDTRGDTPRLIVCDRENNRLQAFGMDGEHLGVISGMFRRPCTAAVLGPDMVVADLAGRVTILDANDELLLHLGDQPDPKLRATNRVDRALWTEGLFLSPHAATWDAEGNLYVMDWNTLGRMTKLERLPAEEEDR